MDLVQVVYDPHYPTRDQKGRPTVTGFITRFEPDDYVGFGPESSVDLLPGQTEVNRELMTFSQYANAHPDRLPPGIQRIIDPITNNKTCFTGNITLYPYFAWPGPDSNVYYQTHLFNPDSGAVERAVQFPVGIGSDNYRITARPYNAPEHAYGYDRANTDRVNLLNSDNQGVVVFTIEHEETSFLEGISCAGERFQAVECANDVAIGATVIGIALLIIPGTEYLGVASLQFATAINVGTTTVKGVTLLVKATRGQATSKDAVGFIIDVGSLAFTRGIGGGVAQNFESLAQATAAEEERLGPTAAALLEQHNTRLSSAITAAFEGGGLTIDLANRVATTETGTTDGLRAVNGAECYDASPLSPPDPLLLHPRCGHVILVVGEPDALPKRR